MNKLTDAEIVKALECCSVENCEVCNKDWSYVSQWDCMRHIMRLVLDLIKRKDAEIEKLEYTIMGIMHSVDKWLEDKELEQDEVNRAATMREKTLKIVEKKQAEIERLTKKYSEKCISNKKVEWYAMIALREKRIEHQDFHKGDDGKFRGYIAIEDLDNIINDL